VGRKKLTPTEVIRIRMTKENALNIRIQATNEQRPFANMLNKIITDYYKTKGE
jgi:hypothetical protein